MYIAQTKLPLRYIYIYNLYGLLGLAGLAGLAGLSRYDTVYSEDGPVNQSSSYLYVYMIYVICVSLIQTFTHIMRNEYVIIATYTE